MNRLYIFLLASALFIFLPGNNAQAKEPAHSQAHENLVEQARGLAYKRHVPITVCAPEDVSSLEGTEFGEFSGGNTLDGLEKSLKIFGFIPYDADYKAILTELRSSQVAGYYSTEAKEICLVSENGRVPEFSKNLGADFSSIDAISDDLNLIHELEHALADQHFGLERMLSGDPDAATAVRALVEGDATFAMLGAVAVLSGYEPLNPVVLREMKSMLPAFVRESHAGTPGAIEQEMLFPYTSGLEFVVYGLRTGGWDAINSAYLDPPTSTEQILHPEKYFTSFRDQPKKILIPDVWRDLIAGYSKIYEGTVGELSIRTLLTNFVPSDTWLIDQAAAGWGGDAFATYESVDTGNLALVWLTTWDRRSDARQFQKAYGYIAQMKYGDQHIPSSYEPEYIPAPSRVMIERQGFDVLVIEGVPTSEEQWRIRDRVWAEYVR